MQNVVSLDRQRDEAIFLYNNSKVKGRLQNHQASCCCSAPARQTRQREGRNAQGKPRNINVQSQGEFLRSKSRAAIRWYPTATPRANHHSPEITSAMLPFSSSQRKVREKIKKLVQFIKIQDQIPSRCSRLPGVTSALRERKHILTNVFTAFNNSCPHMQPPIECSPLEITSFCGLHRFS